MGEVERAVFGSISPETGLVHSPRHRVQARNRRDQRYTVPTALDIPTAYEIEKERIDLYAGRRAHLGAAPRLFVQARSLAVRVITAPSGT